MVPLTAQVAPRESAILATVQVTSITLLHSSHRADIIYLHTTLPPGCPAVDPLAESLTLTVAAGTGEVYVQTNFPGVEVEVINAE